MKCIRKSVIIDMAKGNDNMNMFKLIEFYYYCENVKGLDISRKWDFKTLILNERDLISLMRNGAPVINAVLGKKEGRIRVVGNHGALTKFKCKPYISVILSEIKYAGEDNVIGYRIAQSNGVVRTVKKQDLLSNCAKLLSRGIEYPLQNASFVKNNGKPFIRRNNNENSTVSGPDDGGILVEYIMREKNVHTVYDKKQEEMQKKPEKSLKEQKLEEAMSVYTAEQLAVIKETRKKHSQKWRLITDPKLSAEQMAVLSKGLDKKTNIALINKPEFKLASMKAYIEDMSYGLDIRHYLNPKYTPSQISELSLAYEEGLDLAKIADPSNDANTMAEIRVRLEKQMWSVNFEGTFDEK